MIDIHPVGDLATLLRGMRPELQPGRYAFVPAPPGLAIDPAHVVASVREREGISLVVPEQVALDMGLPVEFVSAWITLGVHSDLEAIGFTAAFSTALARAGIGCNVVAGVHHDHVFVPFAQARQAMDALQALSRSAS